MSGSQISVSTPEVLWHGGGNENGKPDPVYSVDFHPQEHIMCTTGIDANVPPKGSVRIWKVDSESGGQEFLLDLCDHQSAVNVARFSPDGKMLASASDRQIVVYVVENPSVWNHIADVVPLRLWLRPALNEVFDIQWSPDSTHLVVGAIDCKAEIIRLSTRDSLMLPGHTSYIQGVAWDPRGEHVVTQSADRSCKVHKIKSKSGAMVKLAPRGHVVMRMHLGYSVPDTAKKVLTAADFGITQPMASTSTAATAGANASASTGAGVAGAVSSDAANASGEAAAPAVAAVNLFADSYVPSFFRRVSCSPDGALIIAPTGIYHPPGAKASKAAPSSTPSNSFCTHLFARDNLTSPCLSLVGLEEPSVAVRCFARPYKLVKHSASSGTENAPLSMIPGDYRFVFAVVTLGSVFVYDTQHTHPIAKFAGLHYAPINDAAWSEDGRVLVVCSSDGYLSFFRFEPGALGELLEESLVPEVIKRAHPCLFHYVPPVVAEEVRVLSGEAEAEAEADADCAEDGAGTGGNVAGGSAEGEAMVEGTETAESTTAAAASASASATDAKKRKRIQPVVLSGPAATGSGNLAPAPATAPTTATAAGVVSGPVGQDKASESAPSGSIAPVTGTEATAIQASTSASSNSTTAGAEKKQKKRIAPQLLPPSAPIVPVPVVVAPPTVAPSNDNAPQ